MKHLLHLALAIAAVSVAPVRAQEATPKPARKFLMFLPGSKKPEPTPVPPPVAVPVAPKATPRPTPKPTPRATPKPVAKPSPKPLSVSEPKPATPPTEKPEDKLRSTTLEAMSPPVPKLPAPTPTKVVANVTPTPPPAKPLVTTGAKSATVAAAVTAAAVLEKPASPAVVTSTVPPEPAQIVRAFFAMLGQRDIDGAYENLMKGSKIGERPEEVKTLKAKTSEAIEVFGVIHGYDLVEIKAIGERLMRTTYLSLGHELPLRWRFYFYKAEADWKLIDLRVDDKLTGIFDEAMEEVPRNSEARP